MTSWNRSHCHIFIGAGGDGWPKYFDLRLGIYYYDAKYLFKIF